SAALTLIFSEAPDRRRVTGAGDERTLVRGSNREPAPSDRTHTGTRSFLNTHCPSDVQSAISRARSLLFTYVLRNPGIWTTGSQRMIESADARVTLSSFWMPLQSISSGRRPVTIRPR